MNPSTTPDTSLNPSGVASVPAGMVSGSGMAGPVPPGPLNTGTTPVYSMAGPGGLAVPVTPPRDYVVIDSPMSSPTAREAHGDDGENESAKRQRVEDAKKQRINQLRMEYEKRLSAVKIAYKEYFTMDDYDAELDLEKELEDESEIWAGEETLQFQGVPEELWSDVCVDQTPPLPEKWVDDIADKIEIQRLCEMKVLVPEADFTGEIRGQLTTKFVRD